MAVGRVRNAAMAAQSPTSPLAPYQYTVRETDADEVLVKVMYCGICHSDIHMARSEWYASSYPLVPGHEFTGVIEKIGTDVSKFKVGDHVGIGCMVAACDKCESCQDQEQQFCPEMVLTYDSDFKGEKTMGGYGRYVVARASFVCRVPDVLPLDKAAPLLCAGITTYSPMKNNHMDRGGLKIGVVGLGGLGHMALQFGCKLNETNEVWVVSRTAKKLEAAKALGAKGMILSTDDADMTKHANTFDYLIDTVSAPKAMDRFVSLLKPRGSLITVGLPANTTSLDIDVQLLGRKGCSIQGSVIGGIAQTQEMLDFCAAKNILPVVEKIPCKDVNQAYERVLKSDVQFRFVLDIVGTAPEIENK